MLDFSNNQIFLCWWLCSISTSDFDNQPRWFIRHPIFGCFTSLLISFSLDKKKKHLALKLQSLASLIGKMNVVTMRPVEGYWISLHQLDKSQNNLKVSFSFEFFFPQQCQSSLLTIICDIYSNFNIATHRRASFIHLLITCHCYQRLCWMHLAYVGFYRATVDSITLIINHPLAGWL